MRDQDFDNTPIHTAGQGSSGALDTHSPQEATCTNS